MIVCSDYSCPTFIDVEAGDLTPRQPVAGESAQARFEQMESLTAILAILVATRRTES